MKLRTMLYGTNRAGILPPLHKAESSCEATTIHPAVARPSDRFSNFPAAAMFLYLLPGQLQENHLKADPLGDEVRYRYLRVDQDRQQFILQALFRLPVLDGRLF